MFNHMHFQMLFSPQTSHLYVFSPVCMLYHDHMLNQILIGFLSSMYFKSHDHMLNHMHFQMMFSPEMFSSKLHIYMLSLQYVC